MSNTRNGKNYDTYQKQGLNYKKGRWRDRHTLYCINEIVYIYQCRSDNNYFINVDFLIKNIYILVQKNKTNQNIYKK